MSKPDGKSTKSVLLMVSGTLLACNSTAVAADRDITEQNIESLLAEDTLSTGADTQTKKSAATLISQATPITSVIHAKAEPIARFSNHQNVVSPTRQSIRVADAEIAEIQPPKSSSAQFSTGTGVAQPEQPAQQQSEQSSEVEAVQTVVGDASDSDEATSYSAEDLIIPTRFGASFSSSRAGFDEIVGVNAFIPLDQTAGEEVTFVEGDLQLSEGNPSFSLSLGHRGYNADQNVVRGGYVGIDGRSTGESSFYQLATGYERLGEDWDFRINGYLPVGNRTNTIQDVDFDTGLQASSGFEGNELILSAVQERQRIFQQEDALGGFDAEIGTELLDWDGGELMGYAGGYLLSGEDSSLGGQLRLAANFESNFNAGLSLQHDNLFGTSVAFSVNASFPNIRFQDGDEAEFQEEYEVPIRLRDPIARRDNVAVNVVESSEFFYEEDREVLRNPEEEADYRFLHVDLAGGAGAGDGSYENPFGTVEDAIALINSDVDTYSDGNTIVYVDGESAPSSSIPGFTIPDRVRVLSQGPEQIIAGMNFSEFPTTPTRLPFSTEQNFNVSSDDPNANGITVSLPDSNDGVFPVITGGTNADLVTAGNNTVLAGFQIQDATNHGVTANDVDNVELRNNLIQNSGGSGIFLNDVGGNVVLFDNEINNSADRGLFLQNGQTARPLEVAVAGFDLNNNRVGMEFSTVASATEFPSQRIVIGPSTSANTSIGTPGGTSLTNSILNSTNEGLIVQSTGDSLFSSSNQELSVSETTIDGSGAAGIRLLAETGAHTQEFEITDSVITNSGGNGIEVVNGRPPGGPTQTAASQEIVVRNNTISNNDGNGIDIALADASAQELVIRGNQIVDNTGDGIRSLAQTVAIQEWRTDAETGDAGISENVISGNGGQAIVLGLENLAVLPIASIVDNDLSDNGAGADIEITSTSTPGSSAAACLIVSDNATPGGIQLTGTNPLLTGGVPSILVQDLPTLLADPDVTFLSDLLGFISVSNDPFAEETDGCVL
ncbi:MAG: right-handed parallel beta-helix repeat-containing protein [Cyanobacteria bacterium J06635_15]